MAMDFASLREQLAQLDWERGLTRDGIRLRWKRMPRQLYLHLPSEKRFVSAEEVVLYVRRALRLAAEPEMPDKESVADGGPDAWGDSPSGETIVSPDLGHGIGSGANPGYTGGGSVQTGIGREGTTYGDAESSPLPDPRSSNSAS